MSFLNILVSLGCMMLLSVDCLYCSYLCIPWSLGASLTMNEDFMQGQDYALGPQRNLHAVQFQDPFYLFVLFGATPSSLLMGQSQRGSGYQVVPGIKSLRAKQVPWFTKLHHSGPKNHNSKAEGNKIFHFHPVLIDMITMARGGTQLSLRPILPYMFLFI